MISDALLSRWENESVKLRAQVVILRSENAHLRAERDQLRAELDAMRERCASIAQSHSTGEASEWGDGYDSAAESIAKEIRALGCHVGRTTARTTEGYIYVPESRMYLLTAADADAVFPYRCGRDEASGDFRFANVEPVRRVLGRVSERP